jgi:hypothetical protein
MAIFLLLWVPYTLIGGIDCLSLPNEMFGLGVIWVHFSNLSMTSKWVLSHSKENFSNKSKGNYMVEQVSFLHLKACN